MKNPIRIVFVEDDPEMMAVYAENFLMPEFQITTAADGEEAIKLLRDSEAKFDVMVTDHYMPQIDGMKLIKTVRHEFPDIKLLMVTAYGNWLNDVDAGNMDVWKFLDKPVKMSELKQL